MMVIDLCSTGLYSLYVYTCVGECAVRILLQLQTVNIDEGYGRHHGVWADRGATWRAGSIHVLSVRRFHARLLRCCPIGIAHVRFTLLISVRRGWLLYSPCLECSLFVSTCHLFIPYYRSFRPRGFSSRNNPLPTDPTHVPLPCLLH